MGKTQHLNREIEILEKIELLCTDLAFMSVGSIKEEKIKSAIILAYRLINAGKTDELVTVLLEKLQVFN